MENKFFKKEPQLEDGVTFWKREWHDRIGYVDITQGIRTKQLRRESAQWKKNRMVANTEIIIIAYFSINMPSQNVMFFVYLMACS